MASKKETPLWFKRSKEEIEAIVIKLAKEGTPIAKIGLVLRDSYGIPNVKLSGKKITQILRENNIKFETDLDDLIKKAKELRKHFEKNKQDKVAKKGVIATESRIQKYSRYLKKKGLLPKDFEYK